MHINFIRTPARLFALCLLGTVIAGCVNNPSPSLIQAAIIFDQTGCPTSANVNLVSTGRPGQRIQLVSSPDKTGDKFNDFELTFDPFSGRTFKSRKGVLNLPALNRLSIPARQKTGQTQFKYKYVINAQGCEPIDPMIIIDK